MRIRRHAGDRGKFLAKVVQLRSVDAPFYVGTGINAGRGMALKEDHVGVIIAVTAAKKMVETDFIKRCGRSVGRDMTADIGVDAIGFNDHRHRVPANVALYAPLDLTIARVGRLLLRRDRVNVGCAYSLRNL